MATPVKSIQFKRPQDIVDCYVEEGIPVFAIKYNDQINFRYIGDSPEEGKEKLEKALHYLKSNESAAIYTLCVYEDLPGGVLDKGTKPSLECNFRFADNTVGFVNNEQGGYSNLLGEIKAMRTELNELKEGGTPNKLGMVGEILEMESLQPIVMGIAQLIADKIYPAKVGEVARISGLPGMIEENKADWMADEALCNAVTRLNIVVPDLATHLTKLAGIAEKNPKKFTNYLKMFNTFG